MKVLVLRTAIADLAVGRKFYDRQEQGVGDYFFDSLFTEIDSLAIYNAPQNLDHALRYKNLNMRTNHIWQTHEKTIAKNLKQKWQ